MAKKDKIDTFKAGKDIGGQMQKFSQARFMQPSLSYEQKVIQEVMGGGRVNNHWGSGRDLPKMNGDLRTGGGIIKNGDDTNETARMFGF